jgi:hypothetical protein
MKWWGSRTTPGWLWNSTTYYGDPNPKLSPPQTEDLSWPAKPLPSAWWPGFWGPVLWQGFQNDPYAGSVVQIGFGALDFIGGLVMLAGTGGGAVIPGVGLMAVGVDQILTGASNLINPGQPSMSVFQYGGYQAALGLGASDGTAQIVGAITPAALSLFFGGWGGLASGTSQAGRAQSTGWALFFGMKAPPPTGPLSDALRQMMLATAQSPWFRFKANLWSWITGRGPINWTEFMRRLEAAEFREFATVRQAMSGGWAGATRGEIPVWLFGVPRGLRNIPFVGRSAMQHELFHALQDLQYGLFAIPRTQIGFWRGFAIEGAAHLWGGPLAGTPFWVTGGAIISGSGFIGYRLWETLSIYMGW